jgi:hypothetical protein
MSATPDSGPWRGQNANEKLMNSGDFRMCLTGGPMNHHLAGLVTCCVALLWVQDVQASLLFASFKDISESSPSKRFKVEAKSPDNRPDGGGRRFWQSNFVFTCTDTRTGKILWSRKEAAEREGPPVELFVSDSGCAAIRTVGDDVLCIDPKGTVRGKVDVDRRIHFGGVQGLRSLDDGGLFLERTFALVFSRSRRPTPVCDSTLVGAQNHYRRRLGQCRRAISAHFEGDRRTRARLYPFRTGDFRESPRPR